MKKYRKSLSDGARAPAPPPRVDQRHFTNTAKSTKSMNVNPVGFRGGIRL